MLYFTFEAQLFLRTHSVPRRERCINYQLLSMCIKIFNNTCAFNWKIKDNFFFSFPMPPHVHIEFCGSPHPGYGRSVTDFWGWGAHGKQLRCPNDLSGDIWAWGARRGLKAKVYKLPRPRPPWGSSPIRENSYGRTGNRTRDLMSSRQESWPPGHEAGRKIKYIIVILKCIE
jgi:hypothetical protein